jgi:hypothetical protein
MALNEEYFWELTEAEYQGLLSLPSGQLAKEVGSRWPGWDLLPGEKNRRAHGGPAFPDRKDLQRRWRKSRSAREYAKGFQQKDADDNPLSGWAQYNGGIINPRAEDLQPTSYYFRFVDSATPHRFRSAGAWWWDYKTLKLIADFSREHASPRERCNILVPCTGEIAVLINW